MLVTKAGVTGTTEKALFGQLAGNPKALGMSAVTAAAAGAAARHPDAAVPDARRRRRWRWPGITCEPPADAAGGHGAGSGRPNRRRRRKNPITTALHMDDDPPRAGLRPAVAGRQHRRGAAADRPDQGAAPPARRRDRLRAADRAHPGQHAASRQHLRHPRQGDRGRARRACGPTMLLVMDPRGDAIELPGEQTHEPTFGLPAHVDRRRRIARRRCSAATRWSIRRPS